jgi:hypothetical protein
MIRTLMASVLVAGFLSVQANAQALIGTGTLDAGSWDFSAEATVTVLDPGADMTLDVPVSPSSDTFIVAGDGAAIVALPDSEFVDLVYAPETADYVFVVPLVFHQTYAIITTEGNYAKFRFIDPEPGDTADRIEYVYQTNGTRFLDGGIAVERKTWGRIKALFLDPGR